jgi:hypothetical protein
MVDNADLALAKAAQTTGVNIIDYTAAPVYMSGNEKGAHQWLIEFDKVPEDLNRFSVVLDEVLREINSDYDAKRYKNMTMKFPEVIPAGSKLFYNWLSKNKKLGGQHKVPRLSNNRELIEELLKLNTTKPL